MKRMTLAQILSGGIVVCVLIGVGFYLLAISPEQKRLEQQLARNAELESVIAMQAQADRRVEMAREEQRNVLTEWAGFIRRKSPTKDIINLDQDRWRLTTQFHTRFRSQVATDLRNHIRRTGVQLIQAPVVEDFGDNPNLLISEYFHYPTLPFPCAVINCGQVIVGGTFTQILRHIERWNDLPNYIALADGLRLQGTSPNLVGSYNLTLVVYVRGDYINDAAVPWMGGDGGGGGGFGGPTGVGGMPGPSAGPAAPGGLLKSGIAR